MPQLRQYISQEPMRGRASLPRDQKRAQPVGLDLSPLAEAAGSLVKARQWEAEEQDRTKASDLLSTAQFDWTKHELESRAKYDPATGPGYAERLKNDFDEYAVKLEDDVQHAGVRRMMKDRLLAMRTGMLNRALVHEVEARSSYRLQTLGTTLDRRLATAEVDPTQAIDLMAQQTADIDASSELSVIDRREQAEKARGAIAYAAAQTLATRNPSGLRDHPVMALVPADKLPGLLRVAEKSDELQRTQSRADSIMSRGLPLDEAMRLVETEHAGEDERLLKSELQSRYSYAEAARKDREQETYGTALLEVEQRGRVTPATWSKLTDGHRAAVLNRQQAEARQRSAEARGKPVQTDWSLYLDLRDKAAADPAAFAATDLKQYVDRLAPGQMEQLLDIKGRADKPPKSPREVATLTQQMNATMAALNIKRPEAKGKFLSFVQSAVDDAAQAKGKPLSFDERQKIIDEAVLQGPDPDAWLWGTKRAFELTPEQRTRFTPAAATDAPATEIDALNEALKAQGLPQTPANRRAVPTGDEAMNPYAEAAAGLAEEAPRNRYAADAAALAGDRDAAVRTNVYNLAGSPEQAASAAKLGRQTGLPFEVVQRNLPAVQRRVAIERVDADTATAPVLRNRYTDPAFAAAAQDDSGPLARLEGLTKQYTFGNALKKGVAGAKLTLDFAADQLAKAFGADRTETQRILRETGSFYTAQGSDPDLQAAGERAKEAGGGTWYGTLIKLPGEIAEAPNPAAVVGKFLTEQLPASLAGFGIGAAATAPARAAIVSNISNQLVAKGVSTAVAGAAGNGTAVVLQSLGANYQEGLGKGLEAEAAAQRAWTKTLAEVPANAVAGAAMGLRLGPGALGNIFGQAAVQGAGGGIGAAQASQAVGEEADPVEIALEILGEGISAGPEVAGLTWSRIAESRTVARAEAAEIALGDAERVGELIKAADTSVLKTRDAETFAELVEHLQPETVLYVAPEHLAGVDLQAVPTVAVQVAEAAANGGDVEITLADLLAHLPGDKLLPHLRTAPESMTMTEAQAFDGVSEIAEELAAPPADTLLSPGTMSEADWSAYLASADESAQAAIETRDTRSLRDMRWLANAKTKAAAELRGLADAARATIEPEVTAEVASLPAFAAQRFAATPQGKAMHPDALAEMFGYSSADAMAQDIADSGTEADAIERLIEERMREQHPDIADGVSRERSAEALVADRARARFLSTEAAALANAIGSKAALERDAQRYAEQSIARRLVRGIRPSQFEAAADRAGRQAGAAFRKGDTAAAAKLKRDQALQSALQAEATAATSEIERALASFKRMTRPDDGTRDGNLADTARAVLAQYGLAQTDKTAADYLARVEHYDPELHADLLVLMDGLPASVNYRDLTVADFRTVRDRVDAVWSLARSTRQIEIDGQMVEIGAAAKSLADRLSTEPQATRERMVGTNTKLDLRMRLAGMRAALRRVEFWADARDRHDKNGPFRTYIWQPVSEAVTRYRTQRNDYVNRFLALLKTIEPSLKPGKIAAPELGDGMVFADRSALLHALLHTGNESNQRKLLLGYRWAEERPDGSLDTSRWDAFLKRMHAEKRITKADWDFVQATWNLLEEIKPSAQAAHKRMFGHYFAEITAEPVQTPFGELAGGYVPATTDSLLVPEARSHGTMDDLTAGQASPVFPSVARGFTKGRIANYSKPLALDLRLLPAHIDKVARFATLGPVLRDAARLVTRNRVFREAMDAVDPTAVESMLVPWLKRTSTQTLNKTPETQADRAVARVANRVRQRTGLLLMSANVVNTLQQFTGLSVAALRVKPRYLAAGMVEYLRSPGKSAETVNGLSEWMQQRSDSSAADVDRTIDELLTNPNALQRVEQLGTRYGYALQQGAQNLIDRIVWIGAYKEAEAEGLKGSRAVRQADSAVRMTQSSFAPEDASKVEHAGAFTRLFLMFFSYFNAQANLLATEAQHATPARQALVYLLGFAVPAFLAEVIAKGMRGDLGGDDDDGDELAGKLLEAFFMSQARYALAMVPVAGQAGNAAIGQWTPERFDDRIGASPTYSAIESTVRAPRSISRAIEGEGNPKAAVRDGLTAVGVLTGLPTGPLIRPLGYLAGDERDELTVRGLVAGR